MKTMSLTDDQHSLLVDLALEERNAIRETIGCVDEDDILDVIERYNMLGEMFGLENWWGQD